MTPEEIVARFRTLEAERRNLDNRWEIISHFVMPNRGRFFEKESDYEESINWRHRELFDSTAVVSARLLASSIHSNLTSASGRWFGLRFRDEELNKSHEAREWLEECERILYYAINESNFNLEIAECYLDIVAYGTAVLLHESDGKGGFIFKATMAREIYFEEGFDGKLTGIYRFKKYTALQLAEKYPDTIPDYIKEQAAGATTANVPHEIIHCIRLRLENKDADISGELAPEARPYEERYIIAKDSHELTDEASGYYEMPAYVMRWGKAAGSKFGDSPAINVLADIVTLNQLVELVLKSAEKVIDPPTLTQQRGIIGDLDLQPAGVTVVRDINGIKPYESGARFDVSQLQRENLINTIQDSFFTKHLMLKDSPAMTATEVNARYEFMQRVLGPVAGRIKADGLDPLIKRGFFTLSREGRLPEMPAIIAENFGEMDIEYMGPLARVQKMNDVQSTERLLANIGQIAAVAPEVIDTVDWDKLIRMYSERIGVPFEILKTEVEVQQIREARAEQQQQQAQMEQAAQLAGAMKDGSQADLNVANAGELGG
jgi:hypothetical protein